MSKPLILFFFGKQGTGKGTQSAFAGEHFNIPTISAGQLLRDEAGTGSKLGQQIAKIQRMGKLVSGAVISRVIGRRLNQPDCQKGYIMDGFPRNVKQGKSFEQLMKKRQEKITALVLLEADDQGLLDRITTRISCKNGHNFNVKYKPPKKNGICDVDGLPLFQREDDTEKAIQKRWEIYEKDTFPIVDYLQKRGVLVLHVNANPPIEEVKKDLLQQLQKIAKL